MNPETTRHPNWIKVEPGDGAIRKGDMYRQEFDDGSSREGISAHDWTDADFDIPKAAVFIWPRPEPQPYEAIPEGSENAKVMAVSVGGGEPVVGTYYRSGTTVMSIDASLGPIGRYVCRIARITSAAPATVVPTEALNRLRGQKGADGLGATTPQAIAAFLAAVDGADQ